MFASLVDIRTALAELARAFEPDVLGAEACEQVALDATAIEKTAATIKALAAAKVAETDLWRRRGDRSAAHDLARKSGTSVRDARDAIDTGKRLREVPALDEAARKGKVSPQQAAAIADAALECDDPAAAGERLVRKAEQSSLGELRDECLRTKAAARGADEAHRRIKAGRRLRTFTDAEGAWNLSMRDTPEVGAEIMAVIERLRDRIFRAARKEGRSEPSEAYAADALLEAVRRAAGSAGTAEVRPVTGTKVIVRIDWDALIRGWPLEGEVCEIAGVGPVPVSVVQAMIESGSVFLAAVVTKGVDVVNVAHLGRRPTAFQQTGLEWSDPICTALGCTAVAGLQNDHRHDWADTKITLLAWLDRLCRHHHDRKTREDWQLVEGTGKREMVPPDDPRHPRHRSATRDGPSRRADPEAA